MYIRYCTFSASGWAVVAHAVLIIRAMIVTERIEGDFQRHSTTKNEKDSRVRPDLLLLQPTLGVSRTPTEA